MITTQIAITTWSRCPFLIRKANGVGHPLQLLVWCYDVSPGHKSPVLCVCSPKDNTHNSSNYSSTQSTCAIWDRIMRERRCGIKPGPFLAPSGAETVADHSVPEQSTPFHHVLIIGTHFRYRCLEMHSLFSFPRPSFSPKNQLVLHPHCWH